MTLQNPNEFEEKAEAFKNALSAPGFHPEVDGEGPSEEPESTSEQDISPAVIERQPASKPLSRKALREEKIRAQLENLAHENALRASQNQELMERVRTQEALLFEKQQQLAQNEHQKEAYYESHLETQESSILESLKQAKEEGNVEKEVALSKALSDLSAQKATYSLYKNQLKNREDQGEEIDDDALIIQPSMSDLPMREPSYSEVFEDWLDHNPWADPESRSFSPRLRQEADALADELSEMLKYNNLSDVIGTPQYFQSLDALMTERYGSSPQRSSSHAPASTVAPVGRAGASMADQYVGRQGSNRERSTPLSKDEYAIARNLQIRLPNGRYLTGDEAVRRYADAKSAFPVDPTHPNRLTIS